MHVRGGKEQREHILSIVLERTHFIQRNLAMSEANATLLSENEEYKVILAALAAHSSTAGVLEHVRKVKE
jgi:hypothetical protein